MRCACWGVASRHMRIFTFCNKIVYKCPFTVAILEFVVHQTYYR